MSNSKMLIDSTHPEETRVVVVHGGRVEEFDYESAARKLLRGNIYLAKVTRVEPSLQAAFVDYGGNRHGFLAFNEIHPDYYQIPVADRQALIEEEAQAEAEEEAEVDAHAEAQSQTAHEPVAGEPGDDQPGSEDSAPEERSSRPQRRGRRGRHSSRSARSSDRGDDRVSEGGDDHGSAEASHSHDRDHGGDSDDGESGGVHEVDAGGTNGDGETVEEVSTEQDALEEVPSRPRRRMRSYKIQEVIKRRQVVLVQVVKEERGNKGAALTTYLSLAGRYTVLMPNTARGGGISRKITNPGDRKRLKAIANELEVPEGMGLIIRTAGAARTRQEIKRDFEYLLRLWESVRDLTLQSTAPSLVYEEGNLIKRSIRDHFTKDVDEVVVAGDHAYHEAHDFMRMLMPSAAKSVINYKDAEPLFARFRVEQQLNAMFSPFVTLKSGGYLVINQTEALVAIDINSGKSTREFSIEETALNTNLEAADEIARQLKLRDLAGLIVIDFIDMEEKRNNRAVERRIKDALRFDRARIQVGRISHFGLLEMSRQRLRTGVLEGSTTQCPHCQGTGIVRSTESVALAVLRGVEDALMNNPRGGLTASTTAPVAIYILNSKRSYIVEMEARYSIPISVQASDKLHGANFTIERSAATLPVQRRPERQVVNMDWGFDGESEAEVEEIEEVDPQTASDIDEAVGADDDDDDMADAGESMNGDGGQDGGRRGKRRRRRRGRRGDRPEGHGGHGQQRAPHGDEAFAGEHDGAPQRGPLPAFTSYAMQAAAIASGEGEVELVHPRDEGRRGDFAGRDDDHGDGDGERRGRRRGRRGGRRGRERDGSFRPHGNGDANGAGASHNGGSHPNGEAPLLPGQGPQPDLPADLPTEFTLGEGRPPRRRDRWRDRHGNGDHHRRDDSRYGGGRITPAAMIAAQIDAAMAPPPTPQSARPVEDDPAPLADTPVAISAPPVATVEVVPVADPIAEPPAAVLAAVVAEPTPPARPRRSLETTPSEPVIEHVVMRPSELAADASEAAPAQTPTKRGWWQRRFGA
jgi:ribonuclease E